MEEPVINLLQRTACGLYLISSYHADGCIMADRGFNVADCVGNVGAIVLQCLRLIKESNNCHQLKDFHAMFGLYNSKSHSSS